GVMERAGSPQALLDHSAKIDGGHVELAAGGADASGTQNLLDSREQPFAIVQHDAIELFALGFLYFARLQRLEVEPDGGDGSLQLVRHRVDKSIMLLISSNFPDQ